MSVFMSDGKCTQMRSIAWLLLMLCAEGLLAQQHSYDSIRNLNCTTKEKVVRIEALLAKPFADSIVLSHCYHEFAKYLFVNKHFDKSIQYAEQSVVYRAALEDEEKLKKSLYNLGFFYRKADRVTKATGTFQHLIKVGNEDRYRGKAHVELGAISTLNGDFYTALLHHQQAAMIFKRTNHTRDLYKNYMELSRLYALMDCDQYSDKIFTVLSLIDSLGLIIDIDNRDRLIIEQRKGSVFDELKSYEAAIKSYDKALAYGEIVADSEAICIILNNQALSTMKNGELTKAREIYHTAYAQSDDPALRAMVFNNLGDLFLTMSNSDSARYCYQQSISLYTVGRQAIDFNKPSLTEITNSPYKVELLQSLVSMADYWWVVYDEHKSDQFLKLNLFYLELADKLLDGIRFQSKVEYSKRFWSARASSIYSKALRACHAAGDIEKAYYFMERNKAILLLENLSEKQAEVSSHIPDSLIEQKAGLKKRIAVLQQEVYDERKSGRTVSNKGINEVIFSYSAFLDSLKSVFPVYKRYLSKMTIESLSAHKSQLENDDAYSLQYLMNDTECYGLFMGADTTALFNINSDTLAVLLTDFQQHTVKPFKSQRDIDNFRFLSKQLYERLLGNIDCRVLNGNRLAISPDYLLNNLNFESLLVNTEALMKEAFLINYTEISYVYSFSHLMANEAMKRKNDEHYSVFTPGRFLNDKLMALPSSISEGKEVSMLLDGDFYLDSLSNKQQFLTCFEQSKVIHIATHATFSNESVPMIALYDEAVTDQELYSLRCSADLVVLSACGTSRGEFARGEGVMSLARAFLYAGANSVVSTLNNVNDGVSGDIMIDFYENLSSGYSKSSSLRSAKLQYLRNAKGSEVSPYYWAPFVLIGDSGYAGIELPYFSRTILLCISVLILLLILYTFRGFLKT